MPRGTPAGILRLAFGIMPVIPAPLNLDADKAEADFSFLLDAVREVLIDQGDEAVAAALPWGDSSASADPPHRRHADDTSGSATIRARFTR